jgi:hypothetical protein
MNSTNGSSCGNFIKTGDIVIAAFLIATAGHVLAKQDEKKN